MNTKKKEDVMKNQIIYCCIKMASIMTLLSLTHPIHHHFVGKYLLTSNSRNYCHLSWFSHLQTRAPPFSIHLWIFLAVSPHLMVYETRIPVKNRIEKENFHTEECFSSPNIFYPSIASPISHSQADNFWYLLKHDK